MSSIPSNLGRVPNLLRSQIALSSINRTNVDIFRVSNELSTGKSILKPSDDAVKSAAIATVQTRMDRSSQIASNLDVADSMLITLDQALAEATDLLLDAQSIASEQASFGSSQGERESQSVVIQSIIDGLFRVANTDARAGHIFGGSTPAGPPLESFLSGYRYVAQGDGLTTDLGLSGGIPVTLGGGSLVGSISTRVEGSADLDPDLTPDDRLDKLAGARGIGVQKGVVNFSFDGDDLVPVDLSSAETIEDAIARITGALVAYEQETGSTVLGPGGVSFTGDALTIDVPTGTLAFTDIGTGTTALDLGLAADDGSLAFSAANTEGVGLNPSLTWTTPISAMRGLDAADLGQIRLRAHGVTRIVDLSQAETLEDIRNEIYGAGLGLRVEINDEGNGINVFNEVASGADSALAIEEIDGNGLTATALGIRTLSGATELADFNDGQGVRYVSGAVDPDTGDPDPTRDVDFTITLGNGMDIDVNLTPDDVATVDSVLAAINVQATQQLAQNGILPTSFTATLSTDGNGILFTQDSLSLGATGPITIDPKNNSQAAADLGLLDAEISPDGTAMLGEDRARVRPHNAFAWLIDLRDALENDDTAGIALAGERLGAAIDSVAESRALVGGYANRVDQESTALQERDALDAALLSQLQDTDFAEAATRLTLLQTQLQAAMQVTVTSASLSLLDFV